MAKSPAPAPSSPNEEGFVLRVEEPVVTRRIHRKKTPFFLSPLFITTLLLGGAGGGVFFLWQQQQASGQYLLGEIPREATIDEGVQYELPLPFESANPDLTQLKLSVVEGPKGAKIDPQTGKFLWTPTEEEGPGKYLFTVQSQSRSDASAVSKKQFILHVAETNTPVTIPFIENQEGLIGEKLTYLIDIEDPDDPKQSHVFKLTGDVPEGAHVDVDTGLFEWYPDEIELNKPYRIDVEVSEADHPDVKATRMFQVIFKDYDPIARFKQIMDGAGVLLEETGYEQERGFEVTGRTLLAQIQGDEERIGKERIDVFAYSSKKAADDETQFIEPDLSKFFGKGNVFKDPTRIYREDRLFVIASNVSPQLHGKLVLTMGTPIAAIGDVTTNAFAANVPMTPSNLPSGIGANAPRMTPEKETVAGDFSTEQLQQLADLLAEDKLFNKKEHATLRKLFSDRFEARFGEMIQNAWGEDFDAFSKWLADHTEFKERFYTALDPDRDQISAALQLMRDLWKRNPKQFEEYPDLSIALAVVWDDERRGIYDYEHHQVRTHTTLPDNFATAFDIFDYYVAAEKGMEGRAKLVPWEFMKHLVNHKTPIKEQTWAFTNYAPKRVMFGACYSEVPYDDLMLETGSKQCKLQGQEYNLPNILQFGGVCAMQADFAARVGKSMGVPAEYVRGESAFGSHHAWVMWVELKNLTKTGINFSLESHGRYNIDKYYVGELEDPQTGAHITDRQLELRLHTVGLDPIAKRQSDWAMLVYPALKEKNKMALDDQIKYLQSVIALSPGNEAAWTELSLLAGSGNLTRKHERVMRQTLDKLFSTFANFPDFTWTVFDNLIQFEEEAPRQIKLYEQLLQLYLQAGRPDLASEARLMLTGYLIDEKRELEAVEGLASTIMAFPDDGRFTPKLLDRLETLCVDKPVFQKKLIDFYKLFLPKVPQTRGGSPSDYCIAMYERAVDRFTKAGDAQQAGLYKSQLDKLKANAIP